MIISLPKLFSLAPFRYKWTHRDRAVVPRNLKHTHRVEAIFVVSDLVWLTSNQCVIPLSVAVSVHVNDVPSYTPKSNQN